MIEKLGNGWLIGRKSENWRGNSAQLFLAPIEGFGHRAASAGGIALSLDRGMREGARADGLSDGNTFCRREQNTGIEILGVLGRLVNLAKPLVPQEPDDLIQTQAGSRKGRALQFVERL